MTPRQKEYKKQLIKIIHTNKFNVFYDDEQRKAYLEDTFGENSLTKLGITQLQEVRDYVCQKRPAGKMRASATSRQFYYLRKEWAYRSEKKDEQSLLQYCNRILGVYPIRLEILNKRQMSKMIVAVQNLQQRTKTST